MSDPHEKGARKHVHDRNAAAPVAENNLTADQDFIEFNVSDGEAGDQVFITVPNLAELPGHQGPSGPIHKGRKISNHPLGKKVYPRDPLLNRAQIRSRNLRFALTREKKYGNRFLINSKESWTLEERSKLIKSLKKHGIFELEKLCNDVPTKTESQIMSFIEAAQVVTENTLNDKTKDKSASDDMLNPIAQWLYAMEADTGERKDRFSAFNLMLPKVFLYISKYGNHPDPTECGGINYGEAYEYIYHMLSGQPGKDMSPETTRFMRKTLLNLSLRARNGTYEQVDYIKGIHATPTGLSNPHGYRTYTGNAKGSNTSLTPAEKALQKILSLPMANPLKVPMKILEFTGIQK